MRCLLFLLLSLVAIQAVFIHPGHYGGGNGHDHHHDDCSGEKHHSKKPKPTTTVTTPTTPTTTTTSPTTTSPTTTTVKAKGPCPNGYTIRPRTPSCANHFKSFWCMRLITSQTAISVKEGAALCRADGAELTNYENEDERGMVMMWGYQHILSLGLREGSVAVAGHRVGECMSTNATILNEPPCNNKKTAFRLPESSQTDPEYTWTTWIDGEPSSSVYENDVEACIQMNIKPVEASINGFLNDCLCSYAIQPTAVETIVYRNFGALCGVAPKFS